MNIPKGFFTVVDVIRNMGLEPTEELALAVEKDMREWYEKVTGHRPLSFTVGTLKQTRDGTTDVMVSACGTHGNDDVVIWNPYGQKWITVRRLREIEGASGDPDELHRRLNREIGAGN
jgi:hypothetical protein